MGRKPRQSLNSTTLTVTNDSIIDDKDYALSNIIDLDYGEFIKRFGRPDLEEKSQVELVGYESSIAAIKDKIDILLSSREPGFALITGPTGTGKTTVVRKLAEQYSKRSPDDKNGLTFFYLKASWTMEKQFGNPELRLRALFDKAVKESPSLVFIDKIDLICSEKRSHNDSKERIFNVLEDKLECINSSSSRVLVLAATDRPEVLDSQIKKPCYFSDEIKFTLPSRQDRKAFLSSIFAKINCDMSPEQIDLIANASHCYSFMDLKKVCNLAKSYCNKLGQEAKLDYSSFKTSLLQYKPTIIRSITTPCPPLHWDDIGGVDDVKRELQESVIWPLEHRDKFKKLGIQSNKGALLYGPPGCSKTMLAQALATESGYNFISVKGPELFSKWVGDSEAAVRRLYRNAREISPCIIFFDEIDGFAPERSDNQSSSVGDKVVAQLLTELNGIEPLDNVFTIAATNRPDRVDSALIRPGRLDPAIYIPLPSERDRGEIFRVHMRPLSLNFDDSDDIIISKLASITEGYSGAELANVCRVAGTLALRESLKNESIEWRHFEAALERVQPRTKIGHLNAYKKFQERSSHTFTSADQKSSIPTASLQPASNVATLANGQESEHPKKSGLGRLMRSLSIKVVNK